MKNAYLKNSEETKEFSTYILQQQCQSDFRLSHLNSNSRNC